MTVYVDKAHKKFKDVIDDPEYNQICMEDLSQCGLKGYSDLGFYDFDLCSKKNIQQEFIDKLTSLPFKMQVEIDNLLLKKWQAERFDFYDDYQDFMSYYYEDDFAPAELQKEYLSALKDGERDALASDFEEINDVNAIDVVFDYLTENLPNFKYWYITGYQQANFVMFGLLTNMMKIYLNLKILLKACLVIKILLKKLLKIIFKLFCTALLLQSLIVMKTARVPKNSKIMQKK